MSHSAEVGLGGRGHGAPGVRDDDDPVDPEQVDAEDERLQGRLGDACTGVAEDLRVTRSEADHPEGVDP